MFVGAAASRRRFGAEGDYAGASGQMTSAGAKHGREVAQIDLKEVSDGIRQQQQLRLR